MSIWSWGAGTWGQLGSGQVADSQFPVKTILVASTLQQLSCGGNHVAAVSDTSCLVWGKTKAVGASEAVAGDEMLAVPLALPASLFSGDQIQSVSAGWAHTAFVTATGKLFTAGEGAFGQLGLGKPVVTASRPAQVLGVLATCKVHQVACGMHHTVVLGQSQDDGSTHLNATEPSSKSAASTLSVFAFGANRRGQAGIKLLQPDLGQQSQACVQASASESHASAGQQCVLPRESRHCSQNSSAGEAAVGSKVWEPCRVADLQHGAVPCQVLAGGHHSGVLDESGSLHLWGRSYTSQANLFIPEQVARHIPQAVHKQVSQAGHLSPPDDSCHRWLQVSLGWSHVLAVDDKGCVWAWGSNTYGQCGQSLDQLSLSRNDAEGGLITQPTQVQAPGMQSVRHVAAGSEHCAAVTADGEVFAWGWGEHGQLGVGSTRNVSQPTKVHVPACTDVFCGSGFTAALQAG